MYELIITEKPNAAKKIADALANGKPIKKGAKGCVYYDITNGSTDIIVACAVGHLYGLRQNQEKYGKRWVFPVFDIEWVPSSEMSKKSAFSKRYLDQIKKLSKEASSYTVATDYDIEGEVIGLNIVRYACRQKDANRMKFSTLTKDDLIEAYQDKQSHLDWGQAEAGETRHILDWFYGINTSRALTSAIKKAGMFKLMSTGRVQGPALKLIVDKEKEIKAFKPVPFWQIELLGEVNNSMIGAWHKEDKFWKKEEAENVMQNVKGAKEALVDNVEKKQFKQAPPMPFDLTSLQIEAHKTLGISPKNTLEIAQDLYTSGYISYPRTSSQQLSEKIGFRKILSQLNKQNDYKKETEFLLAKKELKPNNGKKTDPAHPAIYPTGIKPRMTDNLVKGIYDLIVRRFLATFGDEAVRETMKIGIDCNNEIFIAKGTTTVQPGWHTLYGRFAKFKDEELPKVEKGDKVRVEKIIMHDKETQPPNRYTDASIIKELEKRNLGTKCLTSNNSVKINCNNQIHTENIAELFESLYDDYPVNEINGMKIAINNKKTCFSFDEFNEVRSNFRLVTKRKLNKNEKVYKIDYKDGSYIEATEDHPLLIFNNNECKYVRVADIKRGMKSVCSDYNHDKEGEVIYTWEDFLKKSHVKTRLYGISNEIKKLRKKYKLSQKKFGDKYGLDQPNVCGYERSQRIPFYVIKKLRLSKPNKIASENKSLVIPNPFPLRMSSSLARILANLVGDGSIDSAKIKRENCYDFRYHNANINLINKFCNDIRKVFGIGLEIKQAKPKAGHLPKYYVRVPALAGRIISILFNEVIKKNSVKIPVDFYPEYIAALFDDEGHCMKSEPKLFISNTNFKLLENVRKMLSDLDIKAILDEKQFKLYIRGKENIQTFLEKIPFVSISKKQRLIDNLSRFYKFGNKLSSPQKQFLIVSTLNSSKDKLLTNREISEMIGLNMSTAKEHLNYLIRNKYLKKVTIGISEYPRKIIKYKLIKSVEETFFKYLDEKVVSPHFITKTVQSVDQINYKGYVYDITNNQVIPNFIMSNGVVVHNSTRASIVDTLFQRGYIDGKSIQATELGIRTCETLEKHCPKILDEELTRQFEEEMEEIREGKKKQQDILIKAKDIIMKIVDDFKNHEKEVGEELKSANIETRDEMSFIGKCTVCKDGELHLRKGKFGSFVACNKYPDCRTTFSLPSNAFVKPAKKLCETCGYPEVLVIKRRKRPQNVCINRECKSKHVDEVAWKEAKEIREGIVEKECPKCKKGKLVLRSSMYGKFYGCERFPKCKYTEKLEDGPLREDFQKK